MTDRTKIARRATAAVAALVALLVLGGSLAGCSAGGIPAAAAIPNPQATPRPPIPKVCVFEACRVRDGALEYSVIMPARWNGTLLLFVPGFYKVFPAPTGRPAPVATSPRATVTHTVIERGFAVAGATYAWGGWSVEQSMRAAELAYAFVSRKVAKPQRTYAWGQSMGGLASTILAQRHPDWVSGTAVACGVVGGTTRFFDSALDVAYAVRTLLAPTLPIDGFPSYGAAMIAFLSGRGAVTRAANGTARTQSLVVLIADLVHTPRGSRGGPPPDPRQRVAESAQILISALGFATLTRWDLENTAHGAVSSNLGVDYGTRVDATERGALERMSPGVTGAALAALARGPRVAADPGARAAVSTQLSPTGKLTKPTVTLHDSQDQVAPLEHEGAFAALVADAGDSARLMQLVTAPPVDWTEGDAATFGVGHCRFSDDELVGLVTVLDDWVTSGQRPGPDAIRADFGTANGLDLQFPVPAWPGAR